MVLHARHRSSLYQKLVPLLGDDDTNALMSQFPAAELDELVTKQFLRAELSEFKGELRDELGGLRGEIGELRAELRGEVGGLRGEIGALRLDLERRMNYQTLRLGGIFVAGMSLLGIFG